MKAQFLIFLGLALGLSAGTAALAGPDLVPGFNVNSGVVSVSNSGNAPAVKSWVTVECFAAGAGSCPDPAPAQALPYENGAFPNKASVTVSPLGPAQNFNHPIAFYGSLTFPPGNYIFVVCADAGNYVSEDVEGNNCRRFPKRVRGRPAGPGGLTSNTD